ncbi:MAG: hypothetical protein R3Y29_02815, partial [bacterium]
MKKRILMVGIIFSMVTLPLQGCSKSSVEVSSNIESTTEEVKEEVEEEDITESTTQELKEE